MHNVIPLQAPNHFGDCPKCGKNDGYLNIGREHWFICNRHRVKWYVGMNIFPGWRNESADDWHRNELLLKNYMEVEPQQQWQPVEGRNVYFSSCRKAEVISLNIYRH